MEPGKPRKKAGTAAVKTVPYKGSDALRDLVVTKANSMIESNYRLSLQEQRVILTCIGHIDSRRPMDEQRVFTIHASEFQARFGVPRQKAYEELKGVVRDLFERELELVDTVNAKRRYIRWVSWIEYEEGKGIVSLSFSEQIAPLIAAISRNFTSYNLSAISGLRSTYALRLYEILTQYKRFGHRTISIQHLRHWLDCVEIYPRYIDFEINAIKKAVDQINATSDMRVEFSRIKQGKEVQFLDFRFSEGEKPSGPAAPSKTLPGVTRMQPESQEDNERKWRQHLEHLGVTPPDLMALAQQPPLFPEKGPAVAKDANPPRRAPLGKTKVR